MGVDGKRARQSQGRQTRVSLRDGPGACGVYVVERARRRQLPPAPRSAQLAVRATEPFVCERRRGSSVDGAVARALLEFCGSSAIADRKGSFASTPQEAAYFVRLGFGPVLCETTASVCELRRGSAVAAAYEFCSTVAESKAFIRKEEEIIRRGHQEDDGAKVCYAVCCAAGRAASSPTSAIEHRSKDQPILARPRPTSCGQGAPAPRSSRRLVSPVFGKDLHAPRRESWTASRARLPCTAQRQRTHAKHTEHTGAAVEDPTPLYPD